MEKPRTTCSVKGCASLVSWGKRTKNGSRIWWKLCSTHHKKKHGMKTGSGYVSSYYRIIPARKCSKCGWEGPCDRHRIAEGSYSKGNVKVLCPNCHRLEHWTKTGLKGPNRGGLGYSLSRPNIRRKR